MRSAKLTMHRASSQPQLRETVPQDSRKRGQLACFAQPCKIIARVKCDFKPVAEATAARKHVFE